jgi:hypothetical protein
MEKTRPMANGTVETHKDAAGCKPSSAYQIREVRLDQDLSGILPGWNQCNARFHDHTIHCDPEWLQEQFKREKTNILVYLFESEAEIMGAVPVAFSHQPLICQFGDFVVGRFPLRVLRLLGYTPNMPAEEPAYDMLFRQMLTSDFDAVFMNYVRADSLLWRYLQTSSLIRKHFDFYSQRGPMPHLVLRMTGTFSEYMQKFSSKTRKNRLREIRKLRDRGHLQLIRVTEPEEVDTFMDAAAEISGKTWQYKRLGWGIIAWGVELLKENLRFLAQRGWLRSYLLKCGGVPCSFIIGQQYGGRFYHAVIGFDPAWTEWSVGTVIQLLVLEDLFNNKPPEVYDFATFAEYKKYFSNESYPEAIVWLFRRRPYSLMASSAFRLCCAASMNAGRILDRLNLKSRVKRLLRGGLTHA